MYQCPRFGEHMQRCIRFAGFGCQDHERHGTVRVDPGFVFKDPDFGYRGSVIRDSGIGVRGSGQIQRGAPCSAHLGACTAGSFFELWTSFGYHSGIVHRVSGLGKDVRCFAWIRLPVFGYRDSDCIGKDF